MQQEQHPAQFPPFFSLPTEICLSILGFLDGNKQAQENFAKCSKRCYILIFPLRFRGITRFYRFDDPEELWAPFDDNGWLAGARGCIRSATIRGSDVSEITPLPRSLARFTNLTELSIGIAATAPIERSIYATILRLLGGLPFYDNLTSLCFKFGAEEAIWEFIELMKTPTDERGIPRLPRDLKTFTLDFKSGDSWDPLFLLPLVDCNALTTLTIQDFTVEDTIEINNHIGSLNPALQYWHLETVKSLNLTFAPSTDNLSYILPVSFPSLTSLTLTIPKIFLGADPDLPDPGNPHSWVDIIPNHPTLKRAEISWTGSIATYQDYESSNFGFSNSSTIQYLKRKLQEGIWPRLEFVKMNTCFFNRNLQLAKTSTACDIFRDCCCAGTPGACSSNHWVFNFTDRMDNIDDETWIAFHNGN
ncbi:hypothetical protein TWF481_011253 [Arthrobotrys musiformis]|uniref:F-box domain-containing protein n=1 Tax=Arthrobotrys musiformis TaxID=47236 RepID=A0AAV9VXQ7_9PEZI